MWRFSASRAKIPDLCRELGTSIMWIGLWPATVRGYRGHNCRIGTDSIQTSTATRAWSEDSRRQTQGPGPRRQRAAGRCGPSPPQNHREQPRRRRRLLSFPTETGVMLAPEGARWLQGMAWRLNGLQAWAAQAIGARASDVRRSHRIQNGFVQSRNGACAQVFELSRERLCWCLSGA